jgi:hypothetical protein
MLPFDKFDFPFHKPPTKSSKPINLNEMVHENPHFRREREREKVTA